MSETFPVIPLNDQVLFPGAVIPLRLSRPGGLTPLVAQLEEGKTPVFVLCKRVGAEDPYPDDLREIGCTGRVLRIVSLPDGTARLLVEGLNRVRIKSAQDSEDGAMVARVIPLQLTEDDPTLVGALEQLLRETLTRLLGENLDQPEQMVEAGRGIKDAGRLADYAAGVLGLSLDRRYELLSEPSLAIRLEALNTEGAKSLQLMEISNRIKGTVQETMDQNQKEYFLREQIKVIRQELGEEGGPDDLDRLRLRLEAAGMPPEVLKEATQELDRMRRMHSDAAEYSVSRTWLDLMAALPWSTLTEDKHDLRHARSVLDEDHHGLEKVKERILEYLAVRQLNPTARGVILCFAGPPGVGKTSLVKSIAQALGRSWQKVSLGGVKDESEIRGHRRTYIGSMPGRIIQAIKRAGSRNPVLLLDELDKLGADYRGDPASALLEVLDPAQNHAFMDHYLDAPFDLSQVMFIATANVEDNIPHALLDRLEIVPLPGYIEEEKTEIARNHLLPRVRAEHGLTEAQLTVTPEAIQQLIRRYTREAGVRQLERELAKLHRKAARRVVEGDSAHIEVTEARLAELIGPPPFHVEPAEHATTPGVAIGLAWTAVGGEILFIEAVRFPQGKGQLRLTGSLGDVMKESVEAAMSLLRSRAERFGIPPEVFTSFDYHVHVPSGGIPKDGPSAGVTMLTALASLMTGRKVRSELAMTGELTLRGKVLPVGGVKEKVLAARRAGIKVVVLPKHNEHDLADIPALLRDDLTFHFVTEADEVLALALEGVVAVPVVEPAPAPAPEDVAAVVLDTNVG
jgi:ATP-dependent Lon protease